MKVLINKCWGGFGVSREAFLELRKMNHAAALEEADIGERYTDGSGPRRESHYDSFLSGIERNDPMLIEVFERLGSGRTSAPLSKLKMVEIPDGTDFEIDDYDGMETVRKRSESWG